MQVHYEQQVPSSFGRVHEDSREFVAELNVIGTAAPLPVEAVGPPIVSIVTRTGLDQTLTAGPGDRVRHRCARYRVQECRFSAT